MCLGCPVCVWDTQCVFGVPGVYLGCPACAGPCLVCVWGARCAPAHARCAVRAVPVRRNWCAYVVTRRVSCVVEDGVERFVKPDYQPCAWGQLQCPRVLA